MRGRALRQLASTENINKLANVLEDLSGDGCRIEKPVDDDGRGWKVVVDPHASDAEPSSYIADVAYGTVNCPAWDQTAQKFVCDVAFEMNGYSIGDTVEWSAGDIDNNGVLWLWIHRSHVAGATGFMQWELQPHNPSTWPAGDDVFSLKFAVVPRDGSGNFTGACRRLVEGTIRMWHVLPDNYDAGVRAWAERQTIDYNTLGTVDPLDPVSTIHNSAHTTLWQDEWPNGKFDIDANGVPYVKQKDANAVARNSHYHLALRDGMKNNVALAAQNPTLGFATVNTIATGNWKSRVVAAVIQSTDSRLIAKLQDWADILEDLLCLGGPVTPACNVEVGYFKVLTRNSAEWVTGEWVDLNVSNDIVRTREFEHYAAFWNCPTPYDEARHDFVLVNGETDFGNLAEALPLMEVELSVLLADWQALQDDMDAIVASSDYQGISSRISALQGRLSSLQSQAGGLEGTVSSLNSSLTSLESRMSALEASA